MCTILCNIQWWTPHDGVHVIRGPTEWLHSYLLDSPSGTSRPFLRDYLTTHLLYISGMHNPWDGSDPRICYLRPSQQVKKYKKLPINDSDFMKEFKLHRTINNFATYYYWVDHSVVDNFWRVHWRRLVKNIGWENQNFWGEYVVKTDKCIGVSWFLGGRPPVLPTKVYACGHVVLVNWAHIPNSRKVD